MIYHDDSAPHHPGLISVWAEPLEEASAAGRVILRHQHNRPTATIVSVILDGARLLPTRLVDEQRDAWWSHIRAAFIGGKEQPGRHRVGWREPAL